MPALFDVPLRALRRDRAARAGVELFLYERAFEDCLERIAITRRPTDRALLIGCPDPAWRDRLRATFDSVDVRDPGPMFARRASGDPLVEDAWLPPEETYDLVLAIGTLDTVNDLPLALRLIGHALKPGGLLIGAVPGGETLPRLRDAMRAADAVSGGAAPHVHPRIEPSALASLFTEAGFADPVVDVDRVSLSYRSLGDLIRDLRGMAATNVLEDRPRSLTRAAWVAASQDFAAAGNGTRTVETVELLHFAAWTPANLQLH